MLILSLCLLTSCENKKLIPHPNQSVLDKIQDSLDENGKDRWANWKVGYNDSERNIYIQVAADPLANEVAMKGYLELIKQIHKREAIQYNMVGRVFKLGKQKFSCIVDGNYWDKR